MYNEYWGLVETPFGNSIDTHWFYESPIHEEALARLLFLIEQQRRCGVLYGPTGTGKSLLLEILSQQVQRTQRQLAVIDLLGKTGPEMLWEMATALGLSPHSCETPAGLWRLLRDFLHGSEAARVQTVVLFDHLERAGDDCCAFLERLVHSQTSPTHWTTVIFSVRTDALPRLAGLLRDLSDLRVELPRLDRIQSHHYVETLLDRAGGKATIFERAALDRLHELSRGVPRELNRLCDLSLLAAMSDGDSRINERLVTFAAEDIQSLNTASDLTSAA